MDISEVIPFTRQDSGKHFLDSGDHYGRIYEKSVPGEMLSADSFSDGDFCGAVISLTHWIAEYSEFNPLHAQFYEWVNQEENSELCWFEAGPEFMELQGYKQATRDNIYNCENDFDQCFVYEVYVPEHDDCLEWYYAENAIVLIYAHTGCDVRGGYASPMILDFKCESGYTMPLDWQVSFYCDQFTDEENETLSLGYSSYPQGELEKIAEDLKVIDNQLIGKYNGEEVIISLDYWG